MYVKNGKERGGLKYQDYYNLPNQNVIVYEYDEFYEWDLMNFIILFYK